MNNLLDVCPKLTLLAHSTPGLEETMSMVDAELEPVSSSGSEAESKSDTDSEMDDVELVANDSDNVRKSNNGRTNIPTLNLAPILRFGQNRRFQGGTQNQSLTPTSSANTPAASTRVDLLSQAFRIKPEMLKKATEEQVPIEELISNGFNRALDVQRDKLRFYIVEEITSPRKLAMDGVNKHIAVAVSSSSFSLNSLESLVEQNKQTSSRIEDCAERLQSSEDEKRVLELQLAHTRDQLKQSEEETRRLNREIEFLRDNLSRQQSTPSPVSDPLISPRLLTTTTASSNGPQDRFSNRMMHLQQLVTENQQLITDLGRRVRTQTEIESLLR